MIELDIKIRAKNHENLKFLIDAMTDSLGCANAMGHVDVQFSASTDGDTMTLVRKEIVKQNPLEALKEQAFTTIEDFILKSDLSKRSVRILSGFNGILKTTLPFKYAEDITKERFLKCTNAGSKSWEEVEAELKRQKIKY